MLGVDECHRRTPDYLLFRRFFEKLCPNVLRELIKPQACQNLLQQLKGTARSYPKYWS